MQKTKTQAEYDRYCGEAAKEQVDYNLKRVAAGRVSQTVYGMVYLEG